VTEVRVLVVGLPRMLRELVALAVAYQPDTELVGEIGGGEPVAEAVQRYRPSVGVLSSEHPDMQNDWPALLRERDRAGFGSSRSNPPGGPRLCTRCALIESRFENCHRRG